MSAYRWIEYGWEIARVGDSIRVLPINRKMRLTAGDDASKIGSCRIAIDSPQHLTHYCLVRADLPVGVQAAQLIHAAGYSSPGNLPAGTYAVALTAQDERELRRLAACLEREGLPHHLIIESDAPYTGQAMALGIEPMDRKRLKPLLSKYPLLKQRAGSSVG